MKNIIFYCLLLLPLFVFAQRIKKEQVPSVVQKAFTQRFPNALMVRWSKIESIYEVSFQKEDNNIEAVFVENGKWLSTQTEIDIAQVPAAVKKTYATICKVQAEDAEKLEKDGEAVEYVLDSPDGNTTLFFSEKGDLLRREKEEE